MRTKDILKDNLPKTNIKSTLKFKWSFDDEIKKTIEILICPPKSRLNKKLGL